MNLTGFDPVLTAIEEKWSSNVILIEEKWSSNVILIERNVGSNYNFTVAVTPQDGGGSFGVTVHQGCAVLEMQQNLTLIKEKVMYISEEFFGALQKRMH